MADVKALLPVCEIDVQLHSLRRDRESKPAELASLEEAVESAEEAIQEADEKVKEIKVEASRHELEMKETEEKIKKFEQDALKVKKNSDFLAIQKAISGVRADQSVITDRWLEVEARVEQASRTKAEAQNDLDAAKAALAREESRIKREIASLDKSIAELEEKRKAAVDGIDGEALELYDRVLRSSNRDGLGLAPIHAQLIGRPRKLKKGEEAPKPEEHLGEYTWHCNVCHTQLTLQSVNLLILGKEIQLCPSCSRLLYHDPAVTAG